MKTSDELHFMLNDNKTQCGEYPFGKNATSKIEGITCRECLNMIQKKLVNAYVMLPLPLMYETEKPKNERPMINPYR